MRAADCFNTHPVALARIRMLDCRPLSLNFRYTRLALEYRTKPLREVSVRLVARALGARMGRNCFELHVLQEGLGAVFASCCGGAGTRARLGDSDRTNEGFYSSGEASIPSNGRRGATSASSPRDVSTSDSEPCDGAAFDAAVQMFPLSAPVSSGEI